MNRPIPRTSWSNDDLKNLTNINNHRATFDGFEYTWEHKLRRGWETHYIIRFDTIEKYQSYLMYNLHNWTTELNHREKVAIKQFLKERAKQDREFKTIIKISNKKLKPIKKIELILEVNNIVPNEQIYQALGMSKATFYRYIKTLKKR